MYEQYMFNCFDCWFNWVYPYYPLLIWIIGPFWIKWYWAQLYFISWIRLLSGCMICTLINSDHSSLDPNIWAQFFSSSSTSLDALVFFRHKITISWSSKFVNIIIKTVKSCFSTVLSIAEIIQFSIYQSPCI